MVSTSDRLGTTQTATAIRLNITQTDIAVLCRPYAGDTKLLHNDAGYVRLSCHQFRVLILAPTFVFSLDFSNILFKDGNRVATLVTFERMQRNNSFPTGDTEISIIREMVVLVPSDRKVRAAEFAARTTKVQIRAIKDMLIVRNLEIGAAPLSRHDRDRIDRLEEQRKKAWIELAKFSGKDLPDVPAYHFPHAHKLPLDGDSDLETVNRMIVINRYIHQTKGSLHYKWCHPQLGYKKLLDPVVPDFMG